MLAVQESMGRPVGNYFTLVRFRFRRCEIASADKARIKKPKAQEFTKFIETLKGLIMPKSSVKKTNKVEVANPNTGRRMQIDAETWDLFSRAIKNSLKGGKALTYTEMVEGIHDYLKKNKIKFEQSVEWYAVTVKHDLHVRKVIDVYMENGRKLHRLKGDQ